jgi:hypothetical protein
VEEGRVGGIGGGWFLRWDDLIYFYLSLISAFVHGSGFGMKWLGEWSAGVKWIELFISFMDGVIRGVANSICIWPSYFRVERLEKCSFVFVWIEDSFYGAGNYGSLHSALHNNGLVGLS